LIALSASAHHSPAAYDQRSEITIDGTVLRYEWANPHVYVHLRDANDANRVWVVEASAPTSLRRSGWSPSTLAVDERVSIVANPPVNRARAAAFGRSLRKADGVVLSMTGGSREQLAASALSARASGLAGLWEAQPTPAGAPSFGARVNLPLTEKGAAASSRFSEASYAVVDCMPPTSPALMQTPFDLKRILVTATEVRIASDYWWGTERIVHLDRATRDGAEPTLQGHSIGRFEGEVLVVETALFAEYSMGNARTVPSSAQKHLVERFAPNAERTGLVYSFVLVDPEYLSAPVSGEQQWAHGAGVTFEPVACNLESARRFRAE
jgi:hypothetical protein